MTYVKVEWCAIYIDFCPFQFSKYFIIYKANQWKNTWKPWEIIFCKIEIVHNPTTCNHYKILVYIFSVFFYVYIYM